MRRCLAAVAVAGTMLAITAIGGPAWASDRSADRTATVFASAAPGQIGVQTTTYGPYTTEGICNYWRYAVAAAGHPVSDCWYWRGWWFQQLD